MATIQNHELTTELVKGSKLNSNFEQVPMQLAEKIVPVMEVNPKLLRRTSILRENNRSTSGTFTIYSTPSNQDFYLTGLYVSFIKDVVCDTATNSQGYYVGCYIDGSLRQLVEFPVITLTAQEGRIYLEFTKPIKIDRNTAITMPGTFTAGVCLRNAIVYGYVDEQSLA